MLKKKNRSLFRSMQPNIRIYIYIYIFDIILIIQIFFDYQLFFIQVKVLNFIFAQVGLDILIYQNHITSLHQSIQVDLHGQDRSIHAQISTYIFQLQGPSHKSNLSLRCKFFVFIIPKSNTQLIQNSRHITHLRSEASRVTSFSPINRPGF